MTVIRMPLVAWAASSMAAKIPGTAALQVHVEGAEAVCEAVRAGMVGRVLSQVVCFKDAGGQITIREEVSRRRRSPAARLSES